EHHDLCKPGYGIKKHDDRVMGTCLVVADHQADKIDGKKTRGVHGVGKSKDDQRAHRHEWRMQPLRQGEPIEHERYDLTASEANDAAEDRIAQQSHQRIRPAFSPISKISTSRRARNIAKGSFVPDSTSRT